ncbi:hypothetical protein [Paraburkholderia sp. UCT2]|uniref:hypothetical protein n=1 Tax=Paraburkholderia sp. UCT2 TaxID=2615208 RepID=UPI00165574FF|nr:hypothetical protein [Paraburkholderia sp. UCT2]MBC8726936.1 hypothetical protein [Paraburkholderia sp. UCT2]
MGLFINSQADEQYFDVLILLELFFLLAESTFRPNSCWWLSSSFCSSPAQESTWGRRSEMGATLARRPRSAIPDG